MKKIIMGLIALSSASAFAVEGYDSVYCEGGRYQAIIASQSDVFEVKFTGGGRAGTATYSLYSGKFDSMLSRNRLLNIESKNGFFFLQVHLENETDVSFSGKGTLFLKDNKMRELSCLVNK